MANRMRLTNPKRLMGPSLTPKSRGLFGEAFSCIFEKAGTVKIEMDDVRRYRVKPKFRERRFVPGRGPLAIWTTGIWEKEAMGMRWLEKKILESVKKRSTLQLRKERRKVRLFEGQNQNSGGRIL